MDTNTLAKSIVDQAVGEKPKVKEKSIAAVQRGKARIASMNEKEMSEHQKKAANKRWQKNRK